MSGSLSTFSDDAMYSVPSRNGSVEEHHYDTAYNVPIFKGDSEPHYEFDDNSVPTLPTINFQDYTEPTGSGLAVSFAIT